MGKLGDQYLVCLGNLTPRAPQAGGVLLFTSQSVLS